MSSANHLSKTTRCRPSTHPTKARQQLCTALPRQQVLLLSTAPTDARKRHVAAWVMPVATNLRMLVLLMQAPHQACVSAARCASTTARTQPPSLHSCLWQCTSHQGCTQPPPCPPCAAVNQIVLEEIIGSSGYKFHSAMDAIQALSMLTKSKTLPDLILLDCMMPRMSGHEFCVQVR
jgi:hypothetical protein